MSFVSFLGQVAKIGLGYGMGALLVIGGVFLNAGGYQLAGGLTFVIGVVLLLFGLYSERQM